MVRVVLRPYASALPLGCFAFAIGNALVGAFGLHWIPATETGVLAIMLLSFAAPLELIPCMMAFLSRDTGTATAMGIFAASWVVQGIQLMTAKSPAPTAAIGVFLALISMCLLILASVTFSGKPLLGVMLVIALFRTIGASLMQFGFSGAIESITAVLGLLVSAFAFYGGLGFLLEDMNKKPLKMTFRRKEAEAALEGSLHHQIERIAKEAGVRKQL